MSETISEPASAAAEPDAERKPGFTEWYAAVVLMLVWVLSYIDRSLPFILIQDIKRDLSLTDTQIGVISGIMFALVFAIMGFPLAALADHWKRKYLLGWAIVFWSGMTALGAFAGNFWHFGLTRLGVAAGEAAVTPTTHSLIGDYFSQAYRGRAVALFLFGAPLGTLLGLLLGGLVNEMANWRLALLLIGAPGAFLALLIFFTLKEPPRRKNAAGDAIERPARFFETLGAFFGNPGLVAMLSAMMLTGLSMGAYGAFTAAYLLRKFDLGTAEIGMLYGVCSAAAGIVGTALGGLVADRFRRDNRAGALIFVGVQLIAGGICGIGALFADSFTVFLIWLVPLQIAGLMQGPPTISTMQNNIPPRMYAMGGVIYLGAFSGVGGSMGPIAAGALSDYFASADPAESLRIALLILIMPYFVASLLFILGGFLLRQRARRAPA